METAGTHAAEMAAHGGIDLVQVVILLAAGVLAVPIFRRLGLGSVLGYLAAGLVVGPFGLKVVSDPQAILHAAELGVVLFLFIIGLEMEPQRLWSLRKQIFGLGVLQVLTCGALLTGVGILLGFSAAVAFVFGMGFVLTSTAIVMQVLEERGELATESGQKVVSILLLEDLAIVPLLAIVAILAPTGEEGDFTSRLVGIGVALGSVIGLVAVGRWILNPVFKFLADSKAREVMTGAALLVVLGAALVMEVGGLSMAMGAFLAGVLLSTSTFKHQLEADVEPFRGLLLGLFFLSVGMALNVSVVLENWQIIALSVVGFMVVKAGAIYVIARLTRSSHGEALERAVMMAQGGEFAFVLYTTAVSAGLISGPTNDIFTATVIVSMVVTPFTLIGLRYIMPKPVQSMEGIEQIPDGLHGRVLIIGFGRFGQIASQPLLALKHRVSIIDNDTDMIRAATQLRFKVYYGDGTRLDILRAAGASTSDIIMICVDKKESATRIAELLRDECPLVRVYARAFDRGHAIELVNAGVEYQIRETFESALVFGGRVAQALGASAEEAAEVLQGVRERDAKRFELQQMGTGGIAAGLNLLISNAEEQAREGGVPAPSPEEESSIEGRQPV
ncbi:monovalent cation:proton antiporter-2 (CPA2) family protein [Paradevosia shaoguanensis]|uniref:monovalent cation:proton antiporter-2 (CPA2) family protein n=1 Tax=Paradevosia shaoguanensis TaxID=1335043 RepID=UPI003C7710C1